MPPTERETERERRQFKLKTSQSIALKLHGCKKEYEFVIQFKIDLQKNLRCSALFPLQVPNNLSGFFCTYRESKEFNQPDD